MKYNDTPFGKIPSNWELKPISEVTDVVTDYVANGSFAALAENVTYKNTEDVAVLIRLVDYNNDYKGEFVFIDEHAYEFLGKSKLFGGEIIISNVGANVGTVFRCPKLPYKMSLAPNAIMVKFKENDSFYYHWLKSHAGQHMLHSIVTGSAQPKFNKTNFRDMLVPVPPRGQQDLIVSILQPLEEKIEQNKKINDNLALQLNTIFEKWFITEAAPNWPIKRIGEYLSLERGLSYKGKYLSETEGVPMLNLGNILPNSVFRPEKLKYYTGDFKQKVVVKPGDIIVANTDLTQAREVLGSAIRVPDLDYDTMICSHHISIVKNCTISKNFILGLLNMPLYRERVAGYATGTTVLALPNETLLNCEFQLPPNAIIDRYDLLADAIYSKMEQLRHENDELSIIRDSLLPKLMSGEIDVSDVKI